MSAVDDLRAAVAALLDAEGNDRAARLLRATRLVLVGDARSWEVGARAVAAQTFALIAPAARFVEIERDAAAREAIRDALRRAIASPETTLSELWLLLELPNVGQGWATVYRTAERSSEATHARDPREIKGGALALAEAEDDAPVAEVLARVELERAPVSEGELERFVVRLFAKDYLALRRDPALAERVTATLGAVARRPGAYQTFELAAAFAPAPSTETPAERSLRAALARRGVALVVIDRDENEVRLVAFGGDQKVARVDLVPGAPPVDSEIRTPLRIRAPSALDDAAADRLAAALFRPRTT